MRASRSLVRLLLVVLVAGCGHGRAAPPSASRPAPPDSSWTVELGTAGEDRAFGLAVTAAGDILVAGSTGGSLGGHASAGGLDAFVALLDGRGAVRWTAQLGSPGEDKATRVAVDAAGEIYVTGSTEGALGDGRGAGLDAFLWRLSPAGQTRWVRQLGSTGAEQGLAVAVAADGDPVIAGFSDGDLPGNHNLGHEDWFVARAAPDGAWRWVREGGTAAPAAAYGLVVSADGDLWIAGLTAGQVATPAGGGAGDIFAGRLAGDGTPRWMVQIGGPADDQPAAAALDPDDHLVVVGRTAATGRPGDLSDALVLVFGDEGKVLWTRQLPDVQTDAAWGVVVDAAGAVTIAGGVSAGYLEPTAGGEDAFVARFAADGQGQWVRQVGTPAADEGWAVTALPGGDLVLAGWTEGSFPGARNAGGKDVFVSRLPPTGRAP